MSFDNERLDQLKALLRNHLDLEEKARKLDVQIPRAKLFVGFINADLAFEEADIIENLLRLRHVTNPPGIVHVFQKANRERSDYLGIARYSSAIKSEIVVGTADEDDRSFLQSLAYHAAALIKLRGHSALLAPAASSASWDTVAGRPDGSVDFVMLEDVPRLIPVVDEVRPVGLEDVKWIHDNFVAAVRLRNHMTSRRFGLAFNLAYTCNHTDDSRIVLFNVWAGLEALFGIREGGKITKKLVGRIVNWLPELSGDTVTNLYEKRCDAVHGRGLEEREVHAALRDSYDVLRAAIIRCIERQEAPLKDWS